MNAGANYGIARAQAQANADYSRQPRYLHRFNEVWWIDSAPCDGCETLTPAAQGYRRATPAELKKSLVIGMSVTCIFPEEAFYSGYGRLPECWFRPGMVGKVGAVRVPGIMSGRLYACIDFYDPAIYNAGAPDEYGEGEKHQWRVGLFYDNILVVRPGMAGLLDRTCWPLPELEGR